MPSIDRISYRPKPIALQVHPPLSMPSIPVHSLPSGRPCQAGPPLPDAFVERGNLPRFAAPWTLLQSTDFDFPNINGTSEQAADPGQAYVELPDGTLGGLNDLRRPIPLFASPGAERAIREAGGRLVVEVGGGGDVEIRQTPVIAGVPEVRGVPVCEYVGFSLGDLLRKLIATSDCLEAPQPPGLCGLPLLMRVPEDRPEVRRYRYQEILQGSETPGLTPGTQVDVSFLLSAEQTNIPGALAPPRAPLDMDGIFVGFGQLPANPADAFRDGLVATMGFGNPRTTIFAGDHPIQQPVRPLAVQGRGNIFLSGRLRGGVEAFVPGPGTRFGYEAEPAISPAAILDGIDARGPAIAGVGADRIFSEQHQDPWDRPACNRFRVTLSIGTLPADALTVPDQIVRAGGVSYSIRINGQFIAGLGIPLGQRRLVSHDYHLRTTYAGLPEFGRTSLVPREGRHLVDPFKYGHVPVGLGEAGIVIGCCAHRVQDGLGIRVQAEAVDVRFVRQQDGIAGLPEPVPWLASVARERA